MIPQIELEWLIHYRCNYRCPYCFFEGIWEEVEERNVYRPLRQWLHAWERIREKYGYTRILITGGEPFIYPDFIELIKELSRDFSIGFDTNLSCSKEMLLDFVEKTNADSISLGLSFHPVFTDFDSFLEKALFLKGQSYRVCVQYVSYPEQIGQMNPYRIRFEEKGLYFIPLPFRGQYNDRLYPAAHTDEEKQLLYSSIENLCAEHQDRVERQLVQVKTRERLCRAGQVYARIDTDGTVYRCGHLVSSPDNRPIGNFFDEGFKLSEKPLPCEQEFCPCEFRWLV